MCGLFACFLFPLYHHTDSTVCLALPLYARLSAMDPELLKQAEIDLTLPSVPPHLKEGHLEAVKTMKRK